MIKKKKDETHQNDRDKSIQAKRKKGGKQRNMRLV